MGLFDFDKEKALNMLDSAKNAIKDATDSTKASNALESIKASVKDATESNDAINALGSATSSIINASNAHRAERAEKKARKAAFAGYAASSHFPVGTQIYVEDDDTGSKIIELEYPDGTIFSFSHEDVQSADICTLGIIGLQKQKIFGTRELKPEEIVASSNLVQVYGAKYKVVLQSGITMMLTVMLGSTLYRIENVLF